MLWLTADLHLGHKRIIGYCERPFGDVKEMAQALIDGLNQSVQADDTLLVLGDFAWGKPQPLLDRIHCRHIKLVPGNHDSRWLKKISVSRMEILPPLAKTVWGGVQIYMCHYPLATWAQRKYGARHAFGHCHNITRWGLGSWNVGVDLNQYKPVSVDRFLEVTSFVR